MNYLSLGELHFLIFIVPGFLTVWTFRYFTHSNKRGDFELLGLSFVWGLVMLLFFELINTQEETRKLLENSYATAIVLSCLGFIAGWLGSYVSRCRYFKKLIKLLSSGWN